MAVLRGHGLPVQYRHRFRFIAVYRLCTTPRQAISANGSRKSPGVVTIGVVGGYALCCCCSRSFADVQSVAQASCSISARASPNRFHAAPVPDSGRARRPAARRRIGSPAGGGNTSDHQRVRRRELTEAVASSAGGAARNVFPGPGRVVAS